MLYSYSVRLRRAVEYGYSDLVRLRRDVEELCGARFVPVASLPFEEYVDVYQVRHELRQWGEVRGRVFCSKAESDRWQDAARTYLDTLSRALEELHRAHGGQWAHVDLFLSEGHWQRLTEPFHWPGWRRRVADRSEKAQRAFLARVVLAADKYRPVREEIERRIERERGVLEQVASRRSWICVGDASTVFVYRLDVSPSDPVPDLAARSQPLTVEELEHTLWMWKMLDDVLDDGVQRRIQWDPRACAEVEKECREQGVDITFAAWWCTVTQGRWKIRRTRATRFGGVHI